MDEGNKSFHIMEAYCRVEVDVICGKSRETCPPIVSS
jgi:hypothetical protein